MTASLAHPVVKEGFQEGQKAFEIYVDDSSNPAGFTQFLDFNGADHPQRIFPHTVVKEEFGGHGLASILVQQALDHSIDEGFKIVALCPYVKAWLEKHPKYAPSTDRPTTEHLKAVLTSRKEH